MRAYLFLTLTLFLPSCLKNDLPRVYKTINERVLHGGTAKTWRVDSTSRVVYTSNYVYDSSKRMQSNDQSITFDIGNRLSITDSLSKLVNLAKSAFYKGHYPKENFKSVEVTSDTASYLWELWSLDSYLPRDFDGKETLVISTRPRRLGQKETDSGWVPITSECWLVLKAD